MTIATIQPSSSWMGNITWTGRAPPANDEMQIFGTTGLREHVVADFDEPPHMWVEADDYTICVPAWTGDRAQIERVDFWLEGTTISVTQKARSPRTGVYGFCITPRSRPGANGEAELYAWVKPVNGRGRLLKLPMVLNTDRTPGVVIARDNIYVDSDRGSDTNDGRDPANPAKTITRALTVLGTNTGRAVHSGIINLRGRADHIVPGNLGGGQNSRMTEIRGQGKTVTRVARPPNTSPLSDSNLFRWSTALLMWRDLTLDTTNISQLYGLNAPGAVAVYKDVKIAREGGAIGLVDKGYPVGGRAPNGLELARSNAFFRSQDGQTQHVLEVEFDEEHICGWRLGRNLSGRHSADVASILPTRVGARSLTFLNSNLRQTAEGEVRLHPALDLVVAAVPVPVDGDTQRTVITFAAGSNLRPFDANTRLRVLENKTGVPVGPENRPEPRCPWDGLPGLPVASDGTKLGPVSGAAGWAPLTLAAENQVIVTDPQGRLRNLQPGDLVRISTTVHADLAIQTISNPQNNAPNPENILIQDVQGYAAGFQIMLMQTHWQTTRDGSDTAGTRKIFAADLRSTGTLVTFGAPHGCQQWSGLTLAGGAQAGETRFIERIVSETQVIIDAPFSADQTDTEWACRRSTKDVAWVNFLADSGAPPQDRDNQVGQMEPCGINWIMISSTVPGKNAAGKSLTFTGFGNPDVNRWRHVFFVDNIFRRLSAGDSADTTLFPVAAQWKGGNNWYMTGRNWDTRTAVPAGSDFWLQNVEPSPGSYGQELVGSITERWETGYRPPAEMTRTHALGVLMPFDIHGRPRTTASPVGAVSARVCT